MQDSFSVRVGKTFDSLPASSWTLGDDEICSLKYNRYKDIPEPESELHQNHTNSSTDDFGNELENDLPDLFEDEYLVEEEEEQQRGSFGHSPESKSNPKTKPDDYDDEEWEIKTSIGLDLTLDYENEEDEYDRFAVEIKGSADHADMNEYVNDEDEIESDDEVPNLLKGFSGDHSLEYGIKSLLKRMRIDDHLSKTEKRFRSLEQEKDEELEEDHWSAAVPDYIRNPARYTHYTFDSSSNMDDISNNQAFLNFRMELLRLMKPDTIEAMDDACIGVSDLVASVPEKRSTDTSKELAPGRIIRPISFLDTDDCEMEEDELATGSSSGRVGVRRTSHRQFRKHTSSELDE